MMEMKDAMPVVFKKSVYELHQLTGLNTNFLIPLFLEFIAYQIHQLSPMEFEDWIKIIPEQCKEPKRALPEMTQAREDLFLTLEMVTNQ